MVDLEIFAQAPDRKRRAHLRGQHVGQVLDEADLAHVFQIAQVLADHPRDPVPAPDAMPGLVLREQRFRKAAEFQQGLEVGAGRPAAQLTQGKRVQAKIPVAPGKRIPALPVVVEPGGAGDDDPAPGFFRIVDAFEQISPAAVFVDLVQEQQWLSGREFRPPQPGRHTGMIPVHVGRMGCVGGLAQKAQRESRLPDLAGPADEDHLALQAVGDVTLQIARGMHGMEYSPLY